MNLRAAMTVVALSVACGSSTKATRPTSEAPPPADAAVPDRCQTFVDRSRPLLAEQKDERGQPLGPADYQELFDYCAGGTMDADANAVVDCVLASVDEPAMRECWRIYLDKSFEFLKR